MALSEGSAVAGATTSRLLNRLAYDIANKANDVVTATTSDFFLIVDASDDYQVKYGDSANLLQLAGITSVVTDNLGATVTIDLAASSTEDGMDITITVKNAAGQTVAGVHQLEVWMSEDADGIGLTADTYSGDLTATAGAILSAHTAKKHWSVATDENGVFEATLVDTNNPADQYVACKAPLGAAVIVSAASGTNWGSGA